VRLLFIADVVGSPGRRAVKQFVPRLRETEKLDFVIANGENAAGGIGMTRETSEELFASQVDAMTSGNHVYDKTEMMDYITTEPRIVRAANYPDGAPGARIGIYNTPKGKLSLVTVLGRTFMKPLDDPFRTARDLCRKASEQGVRFTVFDIHAEATSEKVAFGWWMDGSASLVVGTHTHVPTADERVLPGGTAYITDLGMTGPFDSVIGVEKTAAINRFVTGLPVKFKPAGKDTRLCGVIVDLDDNTGKALGIRRIMERLPDPA
jgi:2',3'-cyclic-nucleotide 2'-phosphodiesterase